MMDSELYDVAAEILRKLREKRASLKTLIYASKYKNVRRLFALASECSKHRELLEEVVSQISDHSLVADLAGGSSELAVVLLYEYLLGHKFGRDVGLRKMVQEYKNEISDAVGKVLLKHQAKTLQEISQKVTEITSIRIPRYMRVNLIKSSVECVVDKLVAEGWSFVGKLDIDGFSEMARSLGMWQFGLDPLLFDLLVFPVGTDLHDHPLTKSGALIQQDRASCVPAHVLNPARGSVTLDCCSAPGNKTSHVASLMNDTGRVIALDRDRKRMETMSRLIQISGATCVEMIVQDFLTVQPDSDDASDIQFILVDPSCSGSGMLGSQSEKFDASNDTQRIQTLKRFQISILKHALRFPAVQRVVYSTCSVHAEENEQVVEEVMAQVSDYFKFRKIFPLWKCSRGLNEYPNSNFFLRLSPETDLTQGFFVACFERIRNKYEQTEGEVVEENNTLEVYHSRDMKDTSSKQHKIDAGENNKSHSKKMKKSATRGNIFEEEPIMEHSTSSTKSSNLNVQGRRKQKMHKTRKSDLEIETSCQEPRLSGDVVPLNGYENNQVFLKNSEKNKTNLTEESSTDRKRKKVPKSEPSVSYECLSSATTKLKKKKHNVNENGSLGPPQKKHKIQVGISENLNNGHEKCELISEPNVRDTCRLNVVCKKKKKKKKKDCDAVNNI